MNLYADTSLLVSYYISDSNSAQAQSLIDATNDPLLFTDLHRLEMRNAFALGVFRKILTGGQVTVAWSDVEQDLKTGLLFQQPARWAATFRAAAREAAKHSPVVGCRSLDVLHVIAAKKLKAVEFFTFDARQKALALKLGLAVKP